MPRLFDNNSIEQWQERVDMAMPALVTSDESQPLPFDQAPQS